MFELILQLKSDYVWYFYYALFYMGLIVHVVYMSVISSPALDSKTHRSGRGLGSNLYTMLFASLLLRFVLVNTSIFCPYDLSEYVYSTL